MWLSREDSNEPGKYHLDRAPYQKEVLDTIWDPKVQRVTLVWGSQLGKTTLLKIVLGYYMDQEPSPILYVMPTLPLARTFSKRRISPMLRDVKVLRGKVKEARSKDSTNNALEKTFPGGVLTIVGANSAASLSSNPIRIVLADERDKWTATADDSGDPFALAVQRTANFENRKVIDLGTPGIKDDSALERSWERSDQRLYHVPCPKCGTYQVLKFAQLKWDKTATGKVTNTRYECESKSCKHNMTHLDISSLLRNGKWIATSTGHPGFMLSTFYSVWFTWGEFAQKWSDAWRSNNAEEKKQVVNENLCEWWNVDQSSIPATHELAKKVEDYTQVPERAVVLTAAVDVQKDRLEYVVVGWGEAEEKWHIHHDVIPGLPTQRSTWNTLDEHLKRTYKHESGVELSISCTTVDSSNWTSTVYDYCKPRLSRRIFAVKGRQGPLPIVDKPKPQGKSRTLLHIVGRDTCIGILSQQVGLPKPAPEEAHLPYPGYIHFNRECNEDYFKSLTGAKLVRRKGKWVWEDFRPNEVLDCWNYNYAAYKILNPDIRSISRGVRQKAEEKKENQGVEVTHKPKKKKQRGSWATMGGLLKGKP